MFVNRKPELTHLEELYQSDRAELFILYGRRRVGKTELLTDLFGHAGHLSQHPGAHSG